MRKILSDMLLSAKKLIELCITIIQNAPSYEIIIYYKGCFSISLQQAITGGKNQPAATLSMTLYKPAAVPALRTFIANYTNTWDGSIDKLLESNDYKNFMEKAPTVSREVAGLISAEPFNNIYGSSVGIYSSKPSLLNLKTHPIQSTINQYLQKYIKDDKINVFHKQK